MKIRLHQPRVTEQLRFILSWLHMSLTRFSSGLWYELSFWKRLKEIPEGYSEKESTESPESAIRLLAPNFKLEWYFYFSLSIRFFVFSVIRIFATIPHRNDLPVGRSAICVTWEHSRGARTDSGWWNIERKKSLCLSFLFIFFPRPAYLNYLLLRDYSLLLLSILIDLESLEAWQLPWGKELQTCHSIIKCSPAARAIVVPYLAIHNNLGTEYSCTLRLRLNSNTWDTFEKYIFRRVISTCKECRLTLDFIKYLKFKLF